jgi:hypothetical protein
VTIRLIVPQQGARQRIQTAEMYALDRKLAVARLKEELAPRVKWWRVKRLLRRWLHQ